MYTSTQAVMFCLWNRRKRRTPCCAPQPTFTPGFIYNTRPSCRPLIGFAWVMSTIDTKYNLISSCEQQRWDGRYWNGTGMAINGTTSSQRSIIPIWFINYPWQWGFYLARHTNWQKRRTRTQARHHHASRRVYMKETKLDGQVKSEHTYATKHGWSQTLPWLDFLFRCCEKKGQSWSRDEMQLAFSCSYGRRLEHSQETRHESEAHKK